jgi:hypothetical protein
MNKNERTLAQAVIFYILAMNLSAMLFEIAGFVSFAIGAFQSYGTAQVLYKLFWIKYIL